MEALPQVGHRDADRGSRDQGDERLGEFHRFIIDISRSADIRNEGIHSSSGRPYGEPDLSASRLAIVSRLSWLFLPRATPISILASPC